MVFCGEEERKEQTITLKLKRGFRRQYLKETHGQKDEVGGQENWVECRIFVGCTFSFVFQ